ncbi:MAG TPA: AMP-binding protein [Acidimicrobiales bacterium]|nr:AMP-binding protein [Acidimicrobiales bacterium]
MTSTERQPARSAPAPGQAPLPAPNAAALLRRNALDHTIAGRPAVRFEDKVWTHGEYVANCRRWANAFLASKPDGPFHVGVLLDNTPEYLFAFGGAALAGATIVGLNHTRRGDNLRRDIEHTDVAIIVTEPQHEELLAPIADQLSCDVLVVGSSLDDALLSVGDDDPGLEPDVDTPWALIFTSGTSDAPKAVICSQRRIMVTGSRFTMMLDLTSEDVGYIAMPLFHSNAVMVGWAPSIVAGASVGLARRFTASGWLPDVRRYGATWFNYTGKPLAYILATPEQPDDADNTLRVAFGNEGSPQVVAEFARRFGVEVIDAFGATEGGVAVNRTDDMPAGAMGLVGETVKVVDEDGHERPRAKFDADGRLVNADECVGEIVNTAGAGPFEGYYNNAEANERARKFGWYWSGDLGYVDDAGYLYFAGRNAEWLRVDGENFPAGPIEAAVSRHPDVVIAAVYGVPDEQAGDQTMAALILRDGASFDPVEFAGWLDRQSDVGPKWRPRYVRVSSELPATATNKVLKRTLVHQKFRADRAGGDPIWVRGRGEDAYRPFTSDDESALQLRFAEAGRERFWDL